MTDKSKSVQAGPVAGADDPAAERAGDAAYAIEVGRLGREFADAFVMLRDLRRETEERAAAGTLGGWGSLLLEWIAESADEALDTFVELHR